MSCAAVSLGASLNSRCPSCLSCPTRHHLAEEECCRANSLLELDTWPLVVPLGLSRDRGWQRDLVAGARHSASLRSGQQLTSGCSCGTLGSGVSPEGITGTLVVSVGNGFASCGFGGAGDCAGLVCCADWPACLSWLDAAPLSLCWPCDRQRQQYRPPEPAQFQFPVSLPVSLNTSLTIRCYDAAIRQFSKINTGSSEWTLCHVTYD